LYFASLCFDNAQGEAEFHRERAASYDAVLTLMRIADINTRAIRYLTGDSKRWRDRKRTPPV
jgi:hypothetical protein